MKQQRYETLAGKTTLVTEDARPDYEVWQSLCNWLALRLTVIESSQYASEPVRMLAEAQAYIAEMQAKQADFRELRRRHGKQMVLYTPSPKAGGWHVAIFVCLPLNTCLAISANPTHAHKP